MVVVVEASWVLDLADLTTAWQASKVIVGRSAQKSIRNWKTSHDAKRKCRDDKAVAVIQPEALVVVGAYVEACMINERLTHVISKRFFSPLFCSVLVTRLVPVMFSDLFDVVLDTG